MHKMARKGKRIGIGIVGGLVVIVGIVAIPYPGPGWLIVFAGLGILATEFDWARRVLDYARARYDAWQAWVQTQPLWFKLLIWLLTALIVVTTIWLLNGYGFINRWLHLHQNWVNSPLPFFGNN